MPFVPDYLKQANRPFVPEWSKALPADGPERIPVRKNPLLLKGGLCLVPGEGLLPMDIKVVGRRIAALARDITAENDEVVSVAGKYVLPGIIDPHVHLGIYGAFEEELASETRSALLNGVTTIGLYLMSPESYLAGLDKIIAQIEKLSWCDLFLHLGIFNQTHLKEIPLYYSRYGITSFKIWQSGIPGLIPDTEDDFLMDVMEKVAALGPNALLNVHAENVRVLNRAFQKDRRAKPMSMSLEDFEKSRPGFAEAEAVQRVAWLAAQTNTPVYFVHLSAKESVQVAAELKKARPNLYFETTSPYLTLCLEQGLSPLNKMTPPIRKKQDQDALWQGLAENVLDTIGTDHSPLTKAEKLKANNIWDIPAGYPVLGTHLPSLLHAARQRDFPLPRLLEAMTLNPARIFGLAPAKGSRAPGSDADLVIVDPEMQKKVSVETAASRSDYALQEDETLTGWPVAVIKAGTYLTTEQLQNSHAPIKSAYLRRRI
jgi:dihydropyrimidinase